MVVINSLLRFDHCLFLGYIVKLGVGAVLQDFSATCSVMLKRDNDTMHSHMAGPSSGKGSKHAARDKVRATLRS